MHHLTSVDDKITFGAKHPGKTLLEVYRDDPGWIVFCVDKGYLVIGPRAQALLDQRFPDVRGRAMVQQQIKSSVWRTQRQLGHYERFQSTYQDRAQRPRRRNGIGNEQLVLDERANEPQDQDEFWEGHTDIGPWGGS